MAKAATLVDVKLRDCRKRRLLSQAQLAALAGVSPATVYKLERGLHQPQPRVARLLAEALKVDPATIDEFRPVLGLDGAD